jgi:hypothetical protein
VFELESGNVGRDGCIYNYASILQKSSTIALTLILSISVFQQASASLGRNVHNKPKASESSGQLWGCGKPIAAQLKASTLMILSHQSGVSANESLSSLFR